MRILYVYILHVKTYKMYDFYELNETKKSEHINSATVFLLSSLVGWAFVTYASFHLGITYDAFLHALTHTS